GAAVVALPVRDLLGHLLRGEVSLVAVAVDDELVPALAVVSVTDALMGQPGEGGPTDDGGGGPVLGRRVQDSVVAVGVDFQAAEAGQGTGQVEGEEVEGFLAADGDIGADDSRLTGKGGDELV